MPYYADPTRPDCHGTAADGIACDDATVETCESEIFLAISSVDRSVHVVRTYQIPAPDMLADSSEAQARLADMFSIYQRPAVVFATALHVADCRDPANADSAACQGLVQGRRLQDGDGTSCTHSDFITRDAAMRTTCALGALDALNAGVLAGLCPSPECANQMVRLINECTESIAHSHTHQVEAFQTIEASPLYISCAELDVNSAAMMAAIRVEFRAPSREVADQLIIQHEQLATGIAQTYQQNCNHGRGRRQLDDEQDKLRLERDTAVADNIRLKDLLANKITTIQEQAVTIAKQAARIADTEPRATSGVISTDNSTISPAAATTRRRQQAGPISCNENAAFTDEQHFNCSAWVGMDCFSAVTEWGYSEHGQADLIASCCAACGQPVVAVRTADTTMRACSTDPCSLQGVCSNGGECHTSKSERGAVSFICSCPSGFHGPRCQQQGAGPAPPPPAPPPPSEVIDGVVVTAALVLPTRGSGVETETGVGVPALFRFTALAGHVYTLEVVLGSLTDSQMELRDSDASTVLAENDDDQRDGGESYASFIEWECTADGTYYVAVRNFDSGIQTPQTFTLVATDLGGPATPAPPAYSVQSGEKTISVVPLETMGQEILFELTNDANRAVFSFESHAGSTYQIQTFLGSSYTLRDSLMDLIDTDLTTILASNDDSGGGDLASFIEWTCPPSRDNQDIFIKVSGFGGSAGSFGISVSTSNGAHGGSVTGGGTGDPCNGGETLPPIQPDSDRIISFQSAGYSNDAACEWVVTCADSGSVPSVTFPFFDTENGFDFLNIYDGDVVQQSDPVVQLSGSMNDGIWIGSETSPAESIAGHQQSMILGFESDGSVNAGGFEASASCSSGGGGGGGH